MGPIRDGEVTTGMRAKELENGVETGKKGVITEIDRLACFDTLEDCEANMALYTTTIELE